MASEPTSFEPVARHLAVSGFDSVSGWVDGFHHLSIPRVVVRLVSLSGHFQKRGTQQKDEPCKSFDLKLSGRKYRRCFCRVILGRPRLGLCKGRSAGHGLVAVLHQTSASNINVDNHNGRTQRINGFWALCSGPILVYLKRSRKLSRSFPRTT